MTLRSLEPPRRDCCRAAPPQLAVGNASDELRSASFGAYARELRQQAGLKIGDMAERVGVSSSHYNRIELNEKAPLDSTRWGPLIDIGANATTLAALEQKYRAKRKPRGRPRAAVTRAPPGQPGSRTWDTLPWEKDDWCWYAVACHPDGLTLEQVGALMGCMPERIRRIELDALAKLALAPEAVEAMEVIDDRDCELAIWTVAADTAASIQGFGV